MNFGGSAFPYQRGDGVIYSSGMTLRDYFAGQALVGVIIAGLSGKIDKKEVFAAWAYNYADDMLAERDKEKEA